MTAQDELAAVHVRRQVHRLADDRGWPAGCQQGAGLTAVAVRGPPPVLVHQVVGENEIERHRASRGYTANFLTKIRCEAINRCQEICLANESLDLRLTAERFDKTADRVLDGVTQLLTMG